MPKRTDIETALVLVPGAGPATFPRAFSPPFVVATGAIDD